MTARALLLDLDNTLVDRDAAVDAWLGALSLARELRDEAVRRDGGGHGDRRSFFAWLAHELGVAPSVVATRFREELPRLVRMRPDARKLVETFTGPKIVVTDGDPDTQRAKACASGVAARVDAIVFSREIGRAKPDARVFRAALARAGTTAHETLAIGDHPLRDVRGATQLGMQALLLRTRWFAAPAGVRAITTLDEALA